MPPLFFLLLLSLNSLPSSIAATTCHPSDRASLLSFRSGLTEPYISFFSSWTGADCCSKWYGVTCDPTTGRVSDLSLDGELIERPLSRSGRSSGLMTGQLSPSLCKLTSLQTLILPDWKQISGPIPSCLPSSLPLLHHLDLAGNRLAGPIPADVGKLKSLTVLNLADNLLSGPLPASISSLTDLRHLDLSNNRLTGPIPANIDNLKLLSRALLSKNRLTGTLPTSIANMKFLADLDLSSNNISGKISPAFGKMNVLSILNLDCNKLSGPVPETLLSKNRLGILNLSRNALEGPIPDVFRESSYFMVLDLSNNKLTGHVPTTLQLAGYIGHINLSHNHLCGPIPSGSVFDHLEAWAFANNDCLCGWPLMKPCGR